MGYNGEPEKEKKMGQFVYYSQIINLDEAIVDKTIEITKLMKIKMPDAIIASTALVYDHTLITRDTADFKRVAGLRLFNPYDAQQLTANSTPRIKP
ncbi:type II toxin-antitoxin system VapC family toxin [Mucilaginibacter glaciei]|uniref:Type II toxin-antitoxin system VapC family toxin n=1 Tax=Mucilaginibacter glaciei TaxID=2772109 RepID=A0A926NVF9_9SPHI|nr:type II toxin-antitoxin system VapC family toxin [Mucilaginibacter glaciei]MBD1394770.1 type II toxin-antitoxin system VapC family toxin [Mucilaginibacter glaciei]